LGKSALAFRNNRRAPVNTTIALAALSSLRNGLGRRYAFERELGRGGTATVFLARDLEQGGHVAVKVLLAELAMTLGTERFLREIEVATSLRHPRIVDVLDSGQADGLLYYVMPFVDGGSLRDRLIRESQLPIDEAIAITRHVAEALAHAHANGVIHRDIKPENILFGAGGPLLADFGVARAVSAAGVEMLTRTGMAVGTPTYMSPEQAAGGKEVTPASDIYSLACVLYEMLAGQPPFNGPTPGVVLARHVLDTPPNLRIMRSGVTDAIEDAIGQALAKSPADRFRSIDEFVAALTDHEGAARRRVPNVARTKPEGPARQGWLRRRMIRVGAALALPILAGGGWLGWRSFALAHPSEDLPKTNVAVLYLQDQSPGKTFGDLADGLTEGLLRQLETVPQLDVAARNGSQFFRGRSGVPIDSIARALKSGTLVTGSVRPVGSNVRVDLELWDGTTGWSVGKRRIELPQNNGISLQDSLTRAVTRVLRRRIGEPMLEPESGTSTRIPAAWDAMLRARHVVLAFDSLTRAGAVAPAVQAAAQADSILSVAQANDESWAEPHIERAWLAYRVSRLLPRADPKFVPQLDSGLAYAAAALDLAPNDSNAIEARGVLRYWKWLNNLVSDSASAAALLASAEQDLTTAASRERSRAQAWNALSHLLINKSQLGRAQAAAERALDLDPFLPDVDRTIRRLFAASLDLGLRDEAVRSCNEGHRRFPANFLLTECKLWLYALPGPKFDMADVWKTYNEVIQMVPPNKQEFYKLEGKLVVALAFVRANQPDSAKALAATSQGDSQIDPAGELTNLASIVYAQAGDKDTALELIAKYLAANPNQRAFAANDKSWWTKDLRADPRYRALVRRGAR
jgi:serine/threonine-protein kinase